MPDDLKRVSSHIPMNPDPAAFAHWPKGLYDEMLASTENGCVGSTLVSETDKVRVWHLVIPVGERVGFHCHVNPYFWSAIAPGKARGYYCNGEIRDVEHFVGETKHYYYGKGESMIHSVENIGDTDLSFCTVEFMDGENDPWPIPDSVRL